jgi:hypothetical protein
MLGFNQEVFHLEQTLHVQTETLPYEDRHQVISQLFSKGIILAIEKMILLANDEEDLSKQIRQFHFDFVRKITQGKYDQEIMLKPKAILVQHQQLHSSPQEKQSKMNASKMKIWDLQKPVLDQELLIAPSSQISYSFLKYLIKQSKI